MLPPSNLSILIRMFCLPSGYQADCPGHGIHPSFIQGRYFSNSFLFLRRHQTLLYQTIPFNIKYARISPSEKKLDFPSVPHSSPATACFSAHHDSKSLPKSISTDSSNSLPPFPLDFIAIRFSLLLPLELLRPRSPVTTIFLNPVSVLCFHVVHCLRSS